MFPLAAPQIQPRLGGPQPNAGECSLDTAKGGGSSQVLGSGLVSTSQTRQGSTWATPCQRASEQPTLFPAQDDGTWNPLENWCDQLFSNVVPMLLRDKEEEPEGRQLFDMDTFLSDISDTLFTMTQPPCPPQQLAEEGRSGQSLCRGPAPIQD